MLKSIPSPDRSALPGARVLAGLLAAVLGVAMAVVALGRAHRARRRRALPDERSIA